MLASSNRPQIKPGAEAHPHPQHRHTPRRRSTQPRHQNALLTCTEATACSVPDAGPFGRTLASSNRPRIKPGAEAHPHPQHRHTPRRRSTQPRYQSALPTCTKATACSVPDAGPFGRILASSNRPRIKPGAEHILTPRTVILREGGVPSLDTKAHCPPTRRQPRAPHSMQSLSGPDALAETGPGSSPGQKHTLTPSTVILREGGVSSLFTTALFQPCAAPG